MRATGLTVTIFLLSVAALNLPAFHIASAQHVAAPAARDSMGIPNDAVAAALAQLAQHPNQQHRQQLHEALRSGVLFLALRPADGEALPEGALENAITASLLTTTTPSGKPALVAFTDLDELKARAPHASSYLVESSSEVLRMVLTGGYAALVLNPAGLWAEVSRSEVEGIIGIK